jgi:hypothetical protein
MCQVIPAGFHYIGPNAARRVRKLELITPDGRHRDFVTALVLPLCRYVIAKKPHGTVVMIRTGQHG